MTTHTFPTTPTFDAPTATPRAARTTRTPRSAGAFVVQLILGSMVGCTLLIAGALALAGAELGYVIGLGLFSGFWVGGGFGLIAAGIFAEPEQ